MFKENLVDVREAGRGYWNARETYGIWEKRDKGNRNGLSNRYLPYMRVMRK